MIRSVVIITIVMALVGFICPNRLDSAGTRIMDIAVTLANLKKYDQVVDIPPNVQMLLSQLKHQLRDALVETINDPSFQDQKPDQLRAEFIAKLEAHGLKLGSCEGPPSLNIFGGAPATGDCEYGVIEDITIEQPQAHADLLAVTTTVGIHCGRDSSFYILKKHANDWQIVFALESNNYSKITEALGSFGYAISPPDDTGQFFLVTVNINPWCSSNWQSIRYNVSRFGATPDQPDILLQKEEMVFLGWGYPFYRLSVQPNWFQLEFGGDQSLDPWYKRIHIAAYDVIGNEVTRVPPFAWYPDDFLDEWIDLPWEEAVKWSAPELKQWHERLRSDRVGEKSIFSSEFLFVQSYGTNQTQWLIGLVFYPGYGVASLPSWLADELLLFTVVQKNELFFLEKIGSTCEEMFPVVQGGGTNSQHINLEIYLQRGLCYTRMDNEETARHEFDLYLTKAIEQAETAPERLAEYYYTRGNTYEQLRQFENALHDYEKASELAEHSYIYHRLAWLLATCPVATIRDGKKALKYATMLCEDSKYSDGDELDSLAAAHAVLGNFSEAVKWEQQAIEHAHDDRKIELFTKRLQLYLSNKPYIQGE